ncbi:MAG TPA: ABC transporter ATP-binding protein [Candidatus Limnocylindria bacterium]|nr:ABC transporter ATP-binding protein [Candidatus Limnocylindria bacterium]
MTPSAGAALSSEGLGFVYPDGTRALTGIDLLVPAGIRLAIVGQNGSGKSTLVRHFNGLLRATEGRVLVGGEEVSRRHVAELAQQVGIAFQNPDRQIFAGSVRSEVAFGPRNLGLRGEELESAVKSALEAVRLGGEGETNPYDLGYSRRKLLTIASVLAMRTPIVVLDEPTTGQDLRGVRTIEGIVATLAAEGRTVIAVSHDLRFVAETFERVVVMRQGTIVLDGTPSEVFAEANWATLRSTNLEPPYAARLGARLGLGSTPTEESLVSALSAGT